MITESGFKTFLISYRHDGAEWQIELPARDLNDAQLRLSKLRYADLDGELVAKIPGFYGPITRIAVSIRNVLCRLVRQFSG